jgi:hypothetical protein
MSSDLPASQARWRTLAAEARDAAHQMTDPEAKLIMLGIAQVYEQVALRAEQRPREKQDGMKDEVARLQLAWPDCTRNPT